MRCRTGVWGLGAAALIMALSLWGPGVAFAQSYDPVTQTLLPSDTERQAFDRGANVSVLQRPRPDYDAKGIHLGGFLVYPKLTSGVQFNDNIYAAQSFVRSDALFTVEPEVDIRSTWSRNSLSAYVRASQDIYSRFSVEDSTSVAVGGSGRLDFGDSTLTADLSYNDSVLPRSAPNNGFIAKHPIPYDTADYSLELAHTFNRLRLTARADYEVFQFQNGVTSAGTQVLEQDENRGVATLTGNAEYAISPAIAVIVTGAYNKRDYELNPPAVPYTRNSSGFVVGAGVDFDLTHFARGEIQLAYMDQTYESHLFKTIAGLSAKGQIEMFPTEVLTVTLAGVRTVADSGIINSAGFLTTDGELQVDYELLRNLILTAKSTVGGDHYYGVSRQDQHVSAGLSASWLLTRRVGMTFAYAFTNQHSSGADRGPSFDDNRVSVSTVLQF